MKVVSVILGIALCWLPTWLAAEPLGSAAGDLRRLAAQFEHGRGVRQDYREAYRLYCQSALLGDAESAYNLGWMYFNGRGFPHRPELASGWFDRAAKAGDAYAKRMLLRLQGIVPAADPACQPPPPPAPAPAAPSARSAHPQRQLIETYVHEIAPRYAIDPELVLLVIKAESGFNPQALSPKNAQGLMQLIPDTAKRFGVKDIWDPKENIQGGTAYLHWLMRHFAGNVEKVLAAYNAGEGAVEQYQGVPPYPETENYVRTILASYRKTEHPIPPALPEKKQS